VGSGRRLRWEKDLGGGIFIGIPQGWLALVEARELVVEREGKEGVLADCRR
jgi:hypothetical protein